MVIPSSYFRAELISRPYSSSSLCGLDPPSPSFSSCRSKLSHPVLLFLLSLLLLLLLTSHCTRCEGIEGSTFSRGRRSIMRFRFLYATVHSCAR